MIPYESIKNLITTYIYGGNIEAGSTPELVTELLATAGCLFIFSVPFLIVWKVIKMIVGD